MSSEPPIARVAALIGDPARALMLSALMDGRSRTAGELARTAGITPQTASGHLTKLINAGLLAIEPQGRHRYHRLASAQVGHALESLMVIARPHSPAAFGPADAGMRHARSCYDHLAGELAVQMADRFIANGWIDGTGRQWTLTEAGQAHTAAVGLRLPVTGTRRPIVKPCLDWSERRPHISGQLGAVILDMALEQRWLKRARGTRILQVSDSGRRALQALAGTA